jgi:hypothetical protein
MASHRDDVYVGVHVGGIIRSDDGGETWTDTIDLHVDVHRSWSNRATGRCGRPPASVPSR